MKIYYYKWVDCINNKNFVIVDAVSRTDADRKFNIWCKDNPEDAPTSYSPREVDIINCLYLNKEK